MKYENSIPNMESPELTYYGFSCEYLAEWWELKDTYNFVQIFALLWSANKNLRF